MNKGSYLLIMNLPEEVNLKYGKRSKSFEAGYYIYIGSAMNSLTGRINHHLSSEKKGRWHIDTFLKFSTIEYIVMIPCAERLEEKLSVSLEEEKDLEVVEGFGASDIKSKGNLFFIKNERFFSKIFKVLKEVREDDSIHQRLG
ncbi:MAG TPA: DUF123 domain-containing protein [Thermotogaceae bacterium]|nr:DUF123 domain-containing protein [Thermotogaceae bacterium]